MFENTKVVKIGNKQYCAYCGKEACEESQYDCHGWEEQKNYSCDCEGAKLDLKHQEELFRLERKHDEEIYPFVQAGKDKIKEITYLYEKASLERSLALLKLNYGQK